MQTYGHTLTSLCLLALRDLCHIPENDLPEIVLDTLSSFALVLALKGFQAFLEDKKPCGTTYNCIVPPSHRAFLGHEERTSAMEAVKVTTFYIN